MRNSSVVLLELHAGASLSKEKRLLAKMERDYEVISPSPQNWSEAGKVLNAVRKRHGLDARKMRDLVNDTLIAVSARTHGATVITNNAKDFLMIQECRPFDLILLHGE